MGGGIRNSVVYDDDESPTELNTLNFGKFLEVDKDKLSCRYRGPDIPNHHGNDVGAIQANRPVPTRRMVYYFELTVVDAGERGCIAIGFTDSTFNFKRQPGWEANGYGYHGDDGRKYHASGKGEAYGPTFTTGDTVGAGLHLQNHEIFFTKNGKMLSVAFRDVNSVLYPTAALHSRNERVEVNFGKKPFVLDLEALLSEEREHQAKAIAAVHMPIGVPHGVVRDYLQYYGYTDTLSALDAACGLVADAPEKHFPSSNGNACNGDASHDNSPCFALAERKALRQLIVTGDIDEALSRVQQDYPSILEDDNTGVQFALNCQKFIELIQTSSVTEAVEFAQSVLSRFRDQLPSRDQTLQDVVALLAYEHPEESPLASLLQFSQREAVADTVNAAVLQHGSPSTQPVLEQLLRQLGACQAELRNCNGNQGEVFDLQRLLNT
eukprot:jgi/Chlat1/7813/Chrsp66S07270